MLLLTKRIFPSCAVSAEKENRKKERENKQVKNKDKQK